ncbi:MAG: endonuclease/exonuclease/phosphatase family protein [Blastochloris sp.]|nr:endonuclease/exonuclease/phosphatase family protein [Blastochloris sp.]
MPGAGLGWIGGMFCWRRSRLSQPRDVLLLGVLVFFGGSILLQGRAGAEEKGWFRITAANLTSGNQQSYDPGHGSRILQGLRPDVVLLQEARFGDKSLAQWLGWVQAVLGGDFVAYREKAELPNAILSRFPILESGSWDDPEQVNRDFAWARLELPEGRRLLVVSVHLSARSAEKRQNSAKALAREITEARVQEELLVIGGDFNVQHRHEPALKALDRLVMTEGPYPVDEQGNENTNRGRNKPYDGIYVSRELHGREKAVSFGGEQLAGVTGGFVFDSRVFKDLSRVSPVQREDSDAPQMQHMAVVRDFSWP